MTESISELVSNSVVLAVSVMVTSGATEYKETSENDLALSGSISISGSISATSSGVGFSGDVGDGMKLGILMRAELA